MQHWKGVNTLEKVIWKAYQGRLAGEGRHCSMGRLQGNTRYHDIKDIIIYVTFPNLIAFRFALYLGFWILINQRQVNFVISPL